MSTGSLLHHPEQQRTTPTCRPRKSDVQGRRIDVLGGKHCEKTGLGVDSRKFVGSDHELVAQNGKFRTGPTVVACGPNTRPNGFRGRKTHQTAQEAMAKQVTKPYKGVAYQDPQHVKVCFQIVRRSRTTEDWKRALRRETRPEGVGGNHASRTLPRATGVHTGRMPRKGAQVGRHISRRISRRQGQSRMKPYMSISKVSTASHPPLSV